MAEGLAPLESLIRSIARLPGLGPRSARRIALHLLAGPSDRLDTLIAQLDRARGAIRPCTVCGNLSASDPCHICSDTKRDPKRLCVVEHVSDLWAMERARVFDGCYHVLGGVLSAMDGTGPDDLNLAGLFVRAQNGVLDEIILATNLTVEGQTTAGYIARHLAAQNLRLTRLAHGVPAGGELDFMDAGTLGAAMQSRTDLDYHAE
ncbi:MAG: recombination mediator RecR [Pseudomonadota bacterium]